jgi:hypothetical protein
MRRRTPRLVVAVYAVFGAFAVHALRYALAPAPGAGAGHGYLGALPPLLAALLAMGMARFGLAVLARRRGDGQALHWGLRWLGGACAFVALFAAQENAEDLLTFGHGAGPSALLGHGGWTVLPLALLAGGVLALLLRGTERAIERVSLALAAGGPHAPRWASIELVLARLRTLATPVVAVLARHLAGRAPPAIS